MGRLESVKNYHLLLRVVALLYKERSDIRVVIVGDGSEQKKLNAYACQLRIDHIVQFVGSAPATDYYSLFDVFVQPSRSEGVSIALLEAMSCGVPCVVTHQGVHPVLTHGQDGLVVPLGGEQLLVHALQSVLCNKIVSKKLAAAAIDTVKYRWAVGTMIQKYKKIFHNCGN